MADEYETPALMLVNYQHDGGEDVALHFSQRDQSIWATQAQIAALFSTDRSSAGEYLGNIFADGELDEPSNVQKLHIAGSTKPVTIYSLDAIISVGYRVNSRTATAFRRWASGIVKAYLEQGYVINERVLRERPDKLNELAAKIRALRASEVQVYAKVRDCFKVSASDYDPKSKEVRRFYALLQDKFHHAITGQTSSKIILDRADYQADNMGLQVMSSAAPTREDAVVGKNYLRSDELYRIHLLSEQFLLFAESTALAGRKMTMSSLHAQLDRLLTLNNYPVFEGWKDFLRDDAIRHAEIELTRYRRRIELKRPGLLHEDDEFEDFTDMEEFEELR